MNNERILDILHQIGLHQVPQSITQFQNEEDDGFYHVWKIEMTDEIFVLKQAKGYELETYQTFFSQQSDYAPRLVGSVNIDGDDYLLLEYIPGKNLMRCSREALIKTLDSLTVMQTTYWSEEANADIGQNYERSLFGRQNRRKYLNDPHLEDAYDAYLREYESVPRTLCHDDLLPFNVVTDDNRAAFIDWEYGGILPYPTSIARLIAHGEEREGAFFYMSDADKQFAIRYYYEKLVRKQGIAYDDYQRSINLFLLYEYCEWVFVGNKYGETDNDRFRRYLQEAKEMAQALGY